MNQQPDKFFREKLEGHQRPVRAGVWDKVEGGLDKKSNKGPWLNMAASLLLVAVAAYLLLSNTQSKSIRNKAHAIAKNEVALPVPESTTKERGVDSSKVSNRFSRGNKYTDDKRWL